jgi:hypothetical protein
MAIRRMGIQAPAVHTGEKQWQGNELHPFHNRAKGLIAKGDKVGDGDGRQDTDDSYNDHQSGMCETCLIHLFHFAGI